MGGGCKCEALQGRLRRWTIQRDYAESVAVDDLDVTHLPDGVDLVNAAAIPLIALTGDQLVRLATNRKKGQVVLTTEALAVLGARQCMG